MVRVLIRRKLAGMHEQKELLIKENHLLIRKIWGWNADKWNRKVWLRITQENKDKEKWTRGTFVTWMWMWKSPSIRMED